jgi:hypothetical protein
VLHRDRLSDGRLLVMSAGCEITKQRVGESMNERAFKRTRCGRRELLKAIDYIAEVTVETSSEQALSRPLYALTVKKYVVFGARSVTVIEVDDENLLCA